MKYILILFVGNFLVACSTQAKNEYIKPQPSPIYLNIEDLEIRGVKVSYQTKTAF